MIACARAEPHFHALDGQIINRRHHFPCVLENGLDATRGGRGVEARLLLGRAHDHGAVVLGKQIRARSAHDVLHRKVGCAREAQNLPANGTHLRNHVRGHAVDGAGPCARAQDDRVSRYGLAIQFDTGHGFVVDDDALNPRTLAHLDTATVARAHQRGEQRARIDLAVVRNPHRRGNPRRERGLHLARLGTGEPLDGKFGVATVLVHAAHRLHVVAMDGNDDRALFAQHDGHIGVARDFRNKRTVPLARQTRELDEVRVLEAGFGDGRNHARRHPAGAFTGAVGVQEQDLVACVLAREPPRNRKSDHAGADDDDAGRIGGSAQNKKPPFHTGWRKAAASSRIPSAGITRIRCLGLISARCARDEHPICSPVTVRVPNGEVKAPPALAGTRAAVYNGTPARDPRYAPLTEEKMHNAVTGAGLFVAAAVTAGFILMTQQDSALAKKYKYPEAAKGDVVDDFHGTKVADPYRWMEDPDAKETQEWVTKQNQLTRAYIDSYAAREAIEDRLKSLFNYERYSLPTREGDRYFFSKNDGLQNQNVLYMQKGLTVEPVSPFCM